MTLADGSVVCLEKRIKLWEAGASGGFVKKLHGKGNAGVASPEGCACRD